jgi:hypothetical protein
MAMKVGKNDVLFALGGFFLGTLGVKALKSQTAKKLAVGAVAQGLKVKSGCEGVLEEARAQFGDIVAEAEYLRNSGDETAAKTVADKVKSGKSGK